MNESKQNEPASKPTSGQETTSILNRIEALERVRKDDNDLGYKERQLRYNKWLAILTAFLVLTSVGAICVSITASFAAKKSADAAENGVLVAQNSLSINKESVEKTLAEMKVQSTASKTNAEEAKLQALIAKKSLKNSIESFRIDERAWVELEPIKPILFAKADEFISASFNYDIYPKNVGKTVARNIEMRAAHMCSGIEAGDNADYIRRAQDMLLHVNVGQNNRITKVLAPNTVSAVPFVLHAQAPQYAFYHFLYGRIDYTDAFSIKHWMKFCYIVNNSRGELVSCKEGNDEDHNPETLPEARR